MHGGERVLTGEDVPELNVIRVWFEVPDSVCEMPTLCRV